MDRPSGNIGPERAAKAGLSPPNQDTMNEPQDSIKQVAQAAKESTVQALQAAKQAAMAAATVAKESGLNAVQYGKEKLDQWTATGSEGSPQEAFTTKKTIINNNPKSLEETYKPSSESSEKLDILPPATPIDAPKQLSATPKDPNQPNNNNSTKTTDSIQLNKTSAENKSTSIPSTSQEEGPSSHDDVKMVKGDLFGGPPVPKEGESTPSDSSIKYKISSNWQERGHEDVEMIKGDVFGGPPVPESTTDKTDIKMNPTAADDQQEESMRRRKAVDEVDLTPEEQLIRHHVNLQTFDNPGSKSTPYKPQEHHGGGPVDRLKETGVEVMDKVKHATERLPHLVPHFNPSAEQRTGEPLYMVKAAEGRNKTKDDPITHAMHDALRDYQSERTAAYQAKRAGAEVSTNFPETLGEAIENSVQDKGLGGAGNDDDDEFEVPVVKKKQQGGLKTIGASALEIGEKKDGQGDKTEEEREEDTGEPVMILKIAKPGDVPFPTPEAGQVARSKL